MMKLFSDVDMTEVARLTRAGKLAEATALLQGRGGSNAAQPGLRPDVGATERTRSFLNRSGANFAKLGKTAGLAKFRQTLQAFGERASEDFALPNLGEERSARPVKTPKGARFEDRVFANEAGSRAYKIFVPSGYKGQALPVVVMLHGCTQDPDDFAAGTRMNEIAEERTFLVAYPHQPKSANMKKCWNWFAAENQQRGGGEASLLASLALAVVEEFSADPRRVYVAGLSAGGAAAAVLATTHPDVFAAVGVHSGLACGAARDMPSAFAAMAGGGAPRANGRDTTVPTIVFHGDADRTVHAINAEQVVEQARPRGSLTEVEMRGETQLGMAYTRIVQLDDENREVVEKWILHGAGHAWSGGSPDGSFTDARGPDASREMIRFFLSHVNAGPGPRN